MRVFPRRQRGGLFARERSAYLPNRFLPRSTESVRKEKDNSKTPAAGEPFGASMTLEAALAFSLFLLICGLFFSFFAGQLLCLRLQHGLEKMNENISRWSYLMSTAEKYSGLSLTDYTEGSTLGGALRGRAGDIQALFSEDGDLTQEVQSFLLQQGTALIWQELLLRLLIREVGEAKLDASCLQGGSNGLSLAGSLLQDRDLDLILSFRVKSLLDWPLSFSYPVVLRSCRRLWIGTSAQRKEQKKEQEDTVYVTETGRAYHKSLGCRVLAIHPKAVTEQELPSLRNEKGGKYYPCEACGREIQPGSPRYVTSDGVRYHSRTDCSKLKRSIQELAVSEAETKYRPCGFCGGE